MEYPVIFCADVGSIKTGRFGWAAALRPGAELESGSDISALCSRVAYCLEHGQKVALGFECPLFVPVPRNPHDLTRARSGEGNRPWSAGAGAAVLATGLTETVWILSKVRSSLSTPPPAFLSWAEFQQSTNGLFLWEAFVTASAKGESHHGDAGIAVETFVSCMPDLEGANAVREDIVYSLIGAALLRSGWRSDLKLLSQACVVIRA
ncbi:MAG: hypothetical protein ACFFCW_26320 [Candidatus Hodarchaeota archaeon]